MSYMHPPKQQKKLSLPILIASARHLWILTKSFVLQSGWKKSLIITIGCILLSTLLWSSFIGLIKIALIVIAIAMGIRFIIAIIPVLQNLNDAKIKKQTPPADPYSDETVAAPNPNDPYGAYEPTTYGYRGTPGSSQDYPFHK